MEDYQDLFNLSNQQYKQRIQVQENEKILKQQQEVYGTDSRDMDGSSNAMRFSELNNQEAIPGSMLAFNTKSYMGSMTADGESQAQYLEILQREKWMPDSKAKQCSRCPRAFTFFVRRHHCRVCGRVFCNYCTEKKHSVNNENIKLCLDCSKEREVYQKSRMQKKNLITETLARTSSMCGSQIENNPSNDDSQNPIKLNQQSNQDISQDQSMLKTTERMMQLQNGDSDQEQNDSLAFETKECNIMGKQIKKYLTDLSAENDQHQMDFNIENNKEMIMNSSRTRSGSGDEKAAERKVKYNLKGFSHRHIEQIVRQEMDASKIDVNKWGNLLIKFVLQAVENVRPSSRMLQDLMDINEYIKIKIVNWTDNSKSEYINGVVLSKNLADRRMRSQIQNPKILLLKDSLELSQMRDKDGVLDLAAVIEQEDTMMTIMQEKLSQVSPNIIIVEKDVEQKVLKMLREQKNMTVISNLHIKKMRKIQRLTQTIITPSVNIIDKSFVLGKCKNFKVVDMKKELHQQDINNRTNRISIGQTQPGKSAMTNTKNLIFFEGCNQVLGCTIILSGPLDTEHDELIRVKKALKRMLPLARNVILERNFLQQIQCECQSLPNFTKNKDGSNNFSATNKLSPFLITKQNLNRSMLVLKKIVVLNKSAMSHSSFKKDQKNQQAVSQAQIQTHDEDDPMKQLIEQQSKTHLDLSHKNEKTENILLESGQIRTVEKQNSAPHHELHMRGLQHQAKMSEINENYVKTKVDCICGQPTKQRMHFSKQVYDMNGQPRKNNDYTLGKFLERFSREAKNKCEHCGQSLAQHFIEYYHKEGCLQISILVKDQHHKHKVHQKEPTIKEIFMYMVCKVCQQHTNKMRMSSQMYEYSTARFIEQFFYNEKLVPRQFYYQCSHGQDCLRGFKQIFEVNHKKIIFDYTPLDIYSIELVQPKKFDTRQSKIDLVSKEQTYIYNSLCFTLEQMKIQVSVVQSHIKKAKHSICLKQALERYRMSNISLFSSMLRQVKKTLKTIENGFKKIIGSAIQEVLDLDREKVFHIYYLKKKIFINLLGYQRAIDECIKMTGVLLVLTASRIKVLSINQAQQLQLSPQNSEMENIWGEISERNESEGTNALNMMGSSQQESLTYQSSFKQSLQSTSPIRTGTMQQSTTKNSESDLSGPIDQASGQQLTKDMKNDPKNTSTRSKKNTGIYNSENNGLKRKNEHNCFVEDFCVCKDISTHTQTKDAHHNSKGPEKGMNIPYNNAPMSESTHDITASKLGQINSGQSHLLNSNHHHQPNLNQCCFLSGAIGYKCANAMHFQPCFQKIENNVRKIITEILTNIKKRESLHQQQMQESNHIKQNQILSTSNGQNTDNFTMNRVGTTISFEMVDKVDTNNFNKDHKMTFGERTNSIKIAKDQQLKKKGLKHIRSSNQLLNLNNANLKNTEETDPDSGSYQKIETQSIPTDHVSKDNSDGGSSNKQSALRKLEPNNNAVQLNSQLNLPPTNGRAASANKRTETGNGGGEQRNIAADLGGLGIKIPKTKKAFKSSWKKIPWVEKFKHDCITLPSQVDNVFIPVDTNDVGSIIAYTLSTNAYMEGMVQVNYQDVQQRVKNMTKHHHRSNLTHQKPQKDEHGHGHGHNDNLNQTTVKEGQHHHEIATVQLIGKDNVFDSAKFSKNQLEYELVGSEKLIFVIKFSTHSKDASLKIPTQGRNQPFNQCSMHFQTGEYIEQPEDFIKNKPSDAMSQNDSDKIDVKPKDRMLNDLQQLVAPEMSRRFLQNQVVIDSINELEEIYSQLNKLYFPKDQLEKLLSKIINPLNSNSSKLLSDFDPHKQNSTKIFNHSNTSKVSNNEKWDETELILSDNVPHNVTFNNEDQMKLDEMNNSQMHHALPPKLLNRNLSQKQMGKGPLQKPAMLQQIKQLYSLVEQGSLFGLHSPSKAMHTDQHKAQQAVSQALKLEKIDFEVKVLFPKRFEALRRFYCGTHSEFLQSIQKSYDWKATGGKTLAKFSVSNDHKYVYKEVKKSEFKMFVEFAPAYFDYLCKSFYHHYPCTLAKILGAYQIKCSNHQHKRYVFLMENMNLGIDAKQEENTVRYDLKGSTLNRFVQTEIPSSVLQDNNYMFEMCGRPLALKLKAARLLFICVNNDTLVLNKNNIVDYSLLTIIDTKRKKIRFGIIDYLQNYTFDRQIETHWKKMRHFGELPTIVEPKLYKKRFFEAVMKYFIGICNQTEKKKITNEDILFEDDDDEEDGSPQNQNQNSILDFNGKAIKVNLNKTQFNQFQSDFKQLNNQNLLVSQKTIVINQSYSGASVTDLKSQ